MFIYEFMQQFPLICVVLKQCFLIYCHLCQSDKTHLQFSLHVSELLLMVTCGIIAFLEHV